MQGRQKAEMGQVEIKPYLAVLWPCLLLNKSLPSGLALKCGIYCAKAK